MCALFGWHDYKGIVRALESGMSVKTLSAILGHSSTAFTMDVYGHITEEFKHDEVSRMRNFL